MQRVGFVHTFICREPTVTSMNDQRLINLHGSVVFHIQCRLALFLGPSMHGLFQQVEKYVDFIFT